MNRRQDRALSLIPEMVVARDIVWLLHVTILR
jgi:hypothetical protein